MFNHNEKTSPDPGILPPGQHLMIDRHGYRWWPDSRFEASQLQAAYGAWFVLDPARPRAVAA